MDKDDLNRRLGPFEELMAGILKNVDQLSREMKELKDYVFENNKVVNQILRHLDDNREEIKDNQKKIEENQQEIIKLRLSQDEDRNLWRREIEIQTKRLEMLEERKN